MSTQERTGASESLTGIFPLQDQLDQQGELAIQSTWSNVLPSQNWDWCIVTRLVLSESDQKLALKIDLKNG